MQVICDECDKRAQVVDLKLPAGWEPYGTHYHRCPECAAATTVFEEKK
jgi:hypothetical protein